MDTLLLIMLHKCLNVQPEAQLISCKTSDTDNVALQQLDPGAAVARGSPLLVRMFVPLWLVNATNLPVGAVVVATQPQVQGKEQKPDESSAHGGMQSAVNSSKLRVMETRAKPA